MDKNIENGIIYHLENSGQFWDKLDDILTQGEHESLAKSSIDVYISFITNFQDSTMYQMFPGIILERLINKSFKHDNNLSPSKELFILFNILFFAGKENSQIFKMIRNKRPFDFINKLKNVIYYQKGEGKKLQLITIQLFFEICCVQPLSQTELDMIDEDLLNHLLDLVEITRDEEDETFNYSIIHLIEEEFLNLNTVVTILSKRIGTSNTFGENIIFMLNRSAKPHIQMLILKLLFEIFTTPETFEYFYTNDLG
nr:6615_t:CDS:2 [Entrophospora candida]